jgi:hypothetical protein
MKYTKTYGKIIIPHKVRPEPHEMDMADVFVSMGIDVTFLQPNTTKGVKTPDVKMKGVLWEFKSPKGKNINTVSNNLRRAVKQSKNVVIDSRRIGLSDDKVRSELLRNVPLIKSLKRLAMIDKEGNVVDIK